MIRELVTSGYKRTIGALEDFFRRLFGPILRRGNLLPILYVLIMVGLAGGIVDALAFPVPNQGAIVYPGAGAQTISEGVLDAFVILLGGAGIYLIYMSGRQTTKARAVNMYLGLALLLLVVSTLAGVQLLQLKGV
jgi:hypothetical protein